MPPLGFRHSGTVDMEAARITRHRQPLTAPYTAMDQPALDRRITIDALPSVPMDLSGLFDP